MRNPIQVKARIKTIEAEIKGIEKAIEREKNFPVVNGLRLELQHKHNIKDAYIWTLDE